MSLIHDLLSAMSHNAEPQKTDPVGNSSATSSTLLLASPHQKVDSTTTAAAAVAVAAVRPHGWVCGVLCAGRVLSVPFLAVDGGYLYITPLGLLLSTHLLPPAPPVAPPPPRPSLQVPTLVLTRGLPIIPQHDEKAAKAAARAVRLEVLRARHEARVRASAVRVRVSAEAKARRYVETCAARVAKHNRLVAAKKTNTGVSKASSAASVSAAAAARKRSRKRAQAAERRRVADAAAGVAKNAKKAAARAAGIKAANRRSTAKRSSITSKSHYAAENAAAAAKADAATAEAAATATAAAAKAAVPWVASRPQFEEDFEVSALLLQIFHRSPFK